MVEVDTAPLLRPLASRIVRDMNRAPGNQQGERPNRIAPRATRGRAADRRRPLRSVTSHPKAPAESNGPEFCRRTLARASERTELPSTLSRTAAIPCWAAGLPSPRHQGEVRPHRVANHSMRVFAGSSPPRVYDLTPTLPDPAKTLGEVPDG
jgi:hypothetical protein